MRTTTTYAVTRKRAKKRVAKKSPKKKAAAKRGRGRPPEKDPREQLPFRIKGSLMKKVKRMGRDGLEALIKQHKA